MVAYGGGDTAKEGVDRDSSKDDNSMGSVCSAAAAGICDAYSHVSVFVKK